MDVTFPAGGYHFRLIRPPHPLDEPTQGAITQLVDREIREVGFQITEDALRTYRRYRYVTLALQKGKLIAFHGMEISPQGHDSLANLGALYVEAGTAGVLGQTLIALNLLPYLLRHPLKKLGWYTLTRSPRVVAAGRRWLHPFYPDLSGGTPPPSSLLGLVQYDLEQRGEGLINPIYLTLDPPRPELGWKPVPLPEQAWCRDEVVNTWMRSALGPAGDRRVVVMGETSLPEVIRVLRRTLSRREVSTATKHTVTSSHR